MEQKTKITGGRLNMWIWNTVEIFNGQAGASMIRRSEAHRMSVFA
jgi:hypothetical protein